MLVQILLLVAAAATTNESRSETWNWRVNGRHSAGACSTASFSPALAGASTERGLASWADWLVTVLVPNPPVWWNESSRVWLYEAVPQLDLLDWGQGQQWDRAGFFRSRGVAVTTKTDYEYEETFEFTNAEALSYFNGSGIAIDELGRPVTYSGYPPGDPYFTTLNGPHWREMIVQGVLRNGAYYGDAVGQDNIGSTLNKIAATWDSSTNARFREWLASSRCFCPDVDCSSPPLLDALSNPDFQVREHLVKLRAQTKTYWNSTVGCSMMIGSESCCAGPCLERLELMATDPLLREYMRASYVFELRNWAEAVTSVKQAAKIAGRKEPLAWGNQWGLTSVYPLAMILSQVGDAVWIESSPAGLPQATLPKQAWTTLNYKLGQAAGSFEKPVFVVQYPNNGVDGSLYYAEAAANGGLFEAAWGCEWTVPGKQNFAEPGGYCAAHLHIAHFLGEHPHLFTDRTRLADVGLIYSLPTVLWRRFSTLTFGTVSAASGIPFLPVFGGIARLMEDHAIGYETLIFGLPGIFDDRASVSRLTQYKTLVLPAVDAISDGHINALAAYVRAGGRLVLIGPDVGSKDEELRPRNVSAFADLIARPGAGRVHLVLNDTMTTFLQTGSLVAEQSIKQVLQPSDPLVDISVGSSLRRRPWANVWRHGGGPATSVALIDYSWDGRCTASNHTLCLHNVSVRLRLADAHSSTAMAFSPEGTYALDVVHDGGYATVVLPMMSYLSVVVFAQSGELDCRAAAAQARRYAQRLEIASRLLTSGPLSHDSQDALIKATTLLNGTRECTSTSTQTLTSTAAALQALLHNVSDAHEVAVTNMHRELMSMPTEPVLKLNVGSRMEGWLTLFGNTTFSTGHQFGWEHNVLQPNLVDVSPQPPCPGPLLCTFCYGFTTCNPVCSGEGGTKPIANGTLVLMLPPGQYIIQLIVGMWGPAQDVTTAITYVSTEQDFAFAKRVRSGIFESRVIEHEVLASELHSDAQPVRITFSGSNVGTRWRPEFNDLIPQAGIVNGISSWSGIGWLLNAVTVHKARSALPHSLATQLAFKRGISAAAVRDWFLLGPLDDSNATGMERAFGPEHDGNLSRTWPGDVRWRRCRAPNASQHTAPLCRWRGIAIDIGSSLGWRTGDPGAAAFLETFVHVGAPTEALLVGSTAGTGAFFLNGVEVLPDLAYVGLHDAEISGKVLLSTGWNRLTVKSLWHFGLGGDDVAVGWAAFAALCSPGPGPLQRLPGMIIDSGASI